MANMTAEEFIAKVYFHLPQCSETPMEKVANARLMREWHRDGWPVQDAIDYCLCMEEFSPDLDEETAIARMDKIQKRHPVK
jgi:hypothetical protein